MTNEEKYKTVEDRTKVFRSRCLSKALNRCVSRESCLSHKSKSRYAGDCMAYWLALEADPDIEPYLPPVPQRN